jgi:hypothetical protein
LALSWKDWQFRCVECGEPIADVLARVGSLLCHDCRDEHGVDAIIVRNPVVESPARRPSSRARFIRRRRQGH